MPHATYIGGVGEAGWKAGGTSRDAAINLLPELKPNQTRFLEALEGEPFGLTAYEVAEKIWQEDFGFTYNPIQDGRNHTKCQVRYLPRDTELKALGLIKSLEEKGRANSGERVANKLILTKYASRPSYQYVEQGSLLS